MPDKRKSKKHVTFDVPANVKGASQSGWVYRSPQGEPTRAAGAGGSFLDALVMPFALPLCLLLALLPAASPRQPSK